MNSKAILSILAFSGVLLACGCNTQQSDSGNQRSYQPAPAPYDDSYEVWVGPGWYYGAYYSNRSHYYNWQRRYGRRGHGGRRYHHRGRGRSYQRHGGGRGRHHGGGRGRGGGRRGGGGGRGGRGGGRR